MKRRTYDLPSGFRLHVDGEHVLVEDGRRPEDPPRPVVCFKTLRDFSRFVEDASDVLVQEMLKRVEQRKQEQGL